MTLSHLINLSLHVAALWWRVTGQSDPLEASV
jgi:hypothetical protein